MEQRTTGVAKPIGGRTRPVTPRGLVGKRILLPRKRLLPSDPNGGEPTRSITN